MEKKIAVLPGDGIGPEVMAQGLKVLDVISEKYGHSFEFTSYDMGAIAIDNHGTPLPDSTLQGCLDSDAVLLGAIGDPKYDNDPKAKARPEQGLLGLRKGLGLFCNIRPLTTYSQLSHLSPLSSDRIQDIDFIIYRELTSGIYFGDKGRSSDRNSAFDVCSYSRNEIERIGKLAFEAALQRDKKLTLIDKANVLESSRLWRETVQDMSNDYPEVEVNYMFVDNAAMQIILNPGQFDVILTGNMFGDIISDEASVLAGSIGLLPSSSIGKKTSLFEPIHGSYPQAAGKDIANPIGTILSVGLMLTHFGLHEEATDISNAVTHYLNQGFGPEDLKPSINHKCTEVGAIISAFIQDQGLLQSSGVEGSGSALG